MKGFDWRTRDRSNSKRLACLWFRDHEWAVGALGPSVCIPLCASTRAEQLASPIKKQGVYKWSFRLQTMSTHWCPIAGKVNIPQS